MTNYSLKFYRKPTANLFSALVATVLSIGSFYCVYDTKTTGAKVLFLIMALLFGVIAVYFIYFLMDKKPILELNETGIKVLYHQPDFYKWENIKEVFVGTLEKTDDAFLCFNLNDNSILKDQKLIYRKATQLNQKTGFGQINIWANVLNLPIEKLYLLLESLIKEYDAKKRKRIINEFKIFHLDFLQKTV